MMQFDMTLLWQFLNILILLILLNSFLFKPVLRAIDKRQKTVGSLFTRVKDTKEDSVRLEKSYDDETKERRKPILALRDSTMAEAHATSQAIIDKARKDLSEELTRMKAEIAGESKKIRDALMGDVEKLGHEAAEKILKRSLS